MSDFFRSTTAAFTLPEPRQRLRQLATVRWGLLVAVLLLAAVGLASVHSASAEMTIDYLPRQLLWVGLGLIVLALVLAVDYQLLLAVAWPLWALSLGALALVLVAGQVRGGARGWFQLGPFAAQPSELAKVLTALVLARYLARADRFLSLRQVATAVGIALVPMVLIAVEPDLGGAAMFVPMVAGMLLVAGLPGRFLVAALLSGALLAGAIWSFGMQPYQRQRVLTFLRPATDPLGAGYQARQSKIAVGSGELTGRGYMQGTQSQLRFLPARHTDFILAVLAEEWGFLGVAAVLGLYALYILNAAQVAMRARDRSGILLVVGLVSIFAFHVLYNCAMVVGLVPITGIPLPFLSYGGSFTLLNFAAAGIILGVDYRRHVNR